MLRIFRIIFKLKGWKIKGEIPLDIKKCVIIAAPHTSNWDFLYSLGALSILRYKINFMAKKELFIPFFGNLLRKAGGIAIDRSKSKHVVDDMINTLKTRENIYLMLAAEGTRKRVTKWKSGFYYAALGANVPIATGYLNYKNKEAGFGPFIYPTGNVAEDMKKIRDFYQTITPKFPENFNTEAIKLT